MNENQIKDIIKDESEYLGWTYEKAIESLEMLNFSLDNIIDNQLFNSSKVRNLVAMAYRAFS